MNIFFLDYDPVKAAQYQCDKHVIKQILESYQLLSGRHHLSTSLIDKSKLYKLTHKNHPCQKWLGESRQNYQWLWKHAWALSCEYSFRYNKTHKSYIKLHGLLAMPPDLPNNGLTFPALAMPDDCIIYNEPVLSYRKYYIDVKMKTIQCKWTIREQPEWIK